MTSATKWIISKQNLYDHLNLTKKSDNTEQ